VIVPTNNHASNAIPRVSRPARQRAVRFTIPATKSRMNRRGACAREAPQSPAGVASLDIAGVRFGQERAPTQRHFADGALDHEDHRGHSRIVVEIEPSISIKLAQRSPAALHGRAFLCTCLPQSPTRKGIRGNHQTRLRRLRRAPRPRLMANLRLGALFPSTQPCDHRNLYQNDPDLSTNFLDEPGMAQASG